MPPQLWQLVCKNKKSRAGAFRCGSINRRKPRNYLITSLSLSLSLSLSEWYNQQRHKKRRAHTIGIEDVIASFVKSDDKDRKSFKFDKKNEVLNSWYTLTQLNMPFGWLMQLLIEKKVVYLLR